MQKNHVKLFLTAIFCGMLMACSQKEDKNEPGEDPDQDQTTVTKTDESGTSVQVETGEGGKVEVKSDDGTDVTIDVDKKGGSVEVKDGENKVEIKVKDDDKK